MGIVNFTELSNRLKKSKVNPLVLTSEQDTSVVAGSRLSVSTNTGIRVFSQAEGIKLFAGKDDVELQVQDGKLIETARDDVEVTSTEGSINLTSPKEIRLRAGGSEIKINSAGVFITTPGIFKVKAATHDLVEPASVPVSLPNLPASYQAQFRFVDDDDMAYADNQYIAVNENTQETFEGMTDKEGNTERFYSPNPDDFKIHLKHKDPWSSIKLYKTKLKFIDDDGIPYSNVYYRATSEVKELVYIGVTNDEGETEELISSIEENFKVHLYVSTNGVL